MSRKKIGILNFQYTTHNYGAVLQAAALEFILKKMGYEPKHIDFMVTPKVSLKASLKGKIGRLLRKMGVRKARKQRTVGNQEAFERFRENFLVRTKRIKNAQDFTRVASNFNSVVVGSDQVWRPRFAKDPVAFFLGYVPTGIHRISYAASFGTDTWELADDETFTKRIQVELKKFKAVSCREDSGVSLCKAIFDVDATHVLDPLLLVDQSFFDQVGLQQENNIRPKVVYYKLDPSDDFTDDLSVLGNIYSSELTNIYLQEGAGNNYREVKNWLSLIYNSDIVVTDSFHCICLALRFGKEVVYCPNERTGQARLDSLFKKFKIKCKFIDPRLKTPMYKLERPSDLEMILQVERLNSRAFLEMALN